MAIREELREAFARARQPRPRNAMIVEHALEQLGDAKAAMLAGYLGQTLDELETTFQLLPLGSRLALEQVGALDQSENSDSQFRVRVLPFAEELVEGADLRLTQEVEGDHGEPLREELARISAERASSKVAFTVEKLDSDTIHEVAASLLPAEFVGRVRALARAERVNGNTRIGLLSLVEPSGNFSRAPISISCRIPELSDFPGSGETVDVEFEVALPKGKPFASLLHSRPRKLSQALKASVDSVPGLSYVYYDPHGESRTARFSTTKQEANAVAQLTVVNGHRTETTKAQ
jgi:hypothetical protein